MKNLFIVLLVCAGFTLSAKAQINCTWAKTNGEAGVNKHFSEEIKQSDGTQLVEKVGNYQLVAKILSDSHQASELRVFYRSDLIAVSYGNHLGIRMIDDTTKYFEISCNEE